MISIWRAPARAIGVVALSFFEVAMSNRAFLLCGLLLLMGDCKALVAASTESPARVLVEQMGKAFTWDREVEMKVTTDEVGASEWLRRQFTYRRDGDRVEWLGSQELLDVAGKPMKDSRYNYTRTFGDKLYLDYQGKAGDARFSANLRHAFSSQVGENRKEFLTDPTLGRFLEGAMYGSGSQDIAQQLATGSTLKIAGTEEVNGVACTIVEGSSRDGIVRAWIAPSLGSNVLKYTTTKTSQDLFNHQTLDQQDMISWMMQVDSITVRQIGDQYVPVSGRFILTIQPKDGSTVKVTITCTREAINLQPDFAKLNAFAIDLPEKTSILDQDFPGIVYEWRGGKIEPVVDMAALAVIDKTFSNTAAKQLRGPEVNSIPVQLGDLVTASRSQESRSNWRWWCATGVAILLLVFTALLFTVKRRAVA